MPFPPQSDTKTEQVISTKSLRDTVHNNQLITNLETPPQIRNALVQPRRKHGVDVAENALVVLKRQFLAQEPHYRLEPLAAADFEPWLS